MSFDLTEQINIVNPISNVDIKYGPYDNVEAAYTAVPKVIRALGRTVGILENGKVKEYWWKDGLENNHLIKKTESEMDLMFSIADDGDIDNGFQVPLSKVKNLAFSGKDFTFEKDEENKVLLIKKLLEAGEFPEFVAVSINPENRTWVDKQEQTNELTPYSAYVILNEELKTFDRYITDHNNIIHGPNTGYSKTEVDNLLLPIKTNIETIQSLLSSDDTRLDDIQEIVNYIKSAQGQIDELLQNYINGIKESDVTLIDDYSTYGLGIIQTQQQLNNALGEALYILKRKADARYTTTLSESGIVEHNLNTYDVEVFFYDTATRYNASARVWRPTPNSVEILFDTEPQNPIRIIVKEI